MKLRILLPLCAVCALLLVACSTSEVTTNRAESPTSSSAPAPAASTAPAAAGEKIGVPECDDFIAAYDACVSTKVPEAARAQYKASIEQWRTSWKKLAENPATKATLAQACKQSAEQARASMKTYNCTF